MEVAFDFDAQRIAGGDEVFENDVDYVLVEDFHVAEGIYVELQTLQFDTTLVRNIFETDGGEVRKIRERADRRELGNLEIDFDFADRETRTGMCPAETDSSPHAASIECRDIAGLAAAK